MTKLDEVLIVLGGGAVGGLISVIDAWTDPLAFPLTFTKFFALLIIPVAKGGVAAGLGVYLLTTLDSTQMVRAFFFSVACGLTFPTIITKGANLADSITSQVASQSVRDNADKIRQITTSGATNANASVGEITNSSIDIIEAESKLTESNKQVAETALKQAISSLSSSAATGNKDALQAITDIGTLSATRGLRTPTNKAIIELKALKAGPNLKDDDKTEALMNIQKLERLM